MSLEYYLQPNPITPDPNDQSARVSTRDNLTEDDLAQELVHRGTATPVLRTGQLSALLTVA